MEALGNVAAVFLAIVFVALVVLTLTSGIL